MADFEQGLDVLRMILRHRKEQPIKGEQIEEITGVPAREVAAIVASCTKRGFAVCSGSHGYWMAATLAEFEEHLEKERKRGVEVLQKVHKAKKNYLNQVTLFDQVAA
ncbi:MAG: hypothetical protein AB1428_13010 [Bacteroidota bacterium]